LYTFIWNPAKNKANQQKHGVSFEEATEAFEDENGLMLEDDQHSYDEQRFLLLGAAFNHLLTVCFCERGNDDEDGNEVIRIISARRASRSERRLYITQRSIMKPNYDFSKAKKNPYATKLKAAKKQITLRLDSPVLDYFRKLGQETHMPWQTLVNMYLRQCVAEKRRPSLTWQPQETDA